MKTFHDLNNIIHWWSTVLSLSLLERNGKIKKRSSVFFQSIRTFTKKLATKRGKENNYWKGTSWSFGDGNCSKMPPDFAIAWGWISWVYSFLTVHCRSIGKGTICLSQIYFKTIHVLLSLSSLAYSSHVMSRQFILNCSVENTLTEGRNSRELTQAIKPHRFFPLTPFFENFDFIQFN